MKYVKSKKNYCKKCKKYTDHKISQVKTGTKRSALSHGSIQRARKRGLGRGAGNLGKYGSKPAISKWKRVGAKGSKKVALVMRCQVCKKASIKTLKRAKKVELK